MPEELKLALIVLGCVVGGILVILYLAFGVWCTWMAVKANPPDPLGAAVGGGIVIFVMGAILFPLIVAVLVGPTLLKEATLHIRHRPHKSEACLLCDLRHLRRTWGRKTRNSPEGSKL